MRGVRPGAGAVAGGGGGTVRQKTRFKSIVPCDLSPIEKNKKNANIYNNHINTKLLLKGGKVMRLKKAAVSLAAAAMLFTALTDFSSAEVSTV